MVAGLDSWQAMELDVALAVKFSTLEKEARYSETEEILASIDNVIRVTSPGIKIEKRKQRQSLVHNYMTPSDLAEQNRKDELPLLSDVLTALGVNQSIVNIEGLEEYNGRQR